MPPKKKSRKGVGGRGKKTPTAIKKKQGTVEKSREPKNPVTVKAVATLKPPEKLINRYAANEFKRVTKALSDLDILYEHSSTILLMYCNSVGLYFMAMAEIKKLGYHQLSPSNGKIISVHYKVANESLEKALKIGGKFGLTPADLDKLEARNPKDGQEEEEWIAA